MQTPATALELAVGQFLEQSLKSSPDQVVQIIETWHPDAIADFLRSTPALHIAKIMRRLNPETTAQMLVILDDCLTEIANFLDPADMARFVARMPEQARDKVLKILPPAYSTDVSELTKYPSDRAGAIMATRVFCFREHQTVQAAWDQLRAATNDRVTYIYIIDADGRLTGRIPVQDLVTSNAATPLGQLAEHQVATINEMASREEVAEMVDQLRLSSVPVVNSAGVLLGVIRQSDLVSLVQQDALADLQTMVGAGKDERALSHALFSVKKRLPWLSINLLTTFVAAFVVGLFENTIAQITALAVLLPVVAGQSGNTGAQAQAVTMRGLALREVRLRHKWQILRKEGTVGFVNGTVIGSLCCGSVVFWSGNLGLGLVIGFSMILAMVAASLSGAAIPLLLTALKQDPAQSSSIILTTITDIVGFLSFLGLAALFASQLT